jgi:hypothetical protein
MLPTNFPPREAVCRQAQLWLEADEGIKPQVIELQRPQKGLRSSVSTMGG